MFFRGGAELLFNKIKKHDLILPQKDEPCGFNFKAVFNIYTRFITYILLLLFSFSGTLKSLIAWLKENLLTEKPELFVQGENM